MNGMEPTGPESNRTSPAARYSRERGVLPLNYLGIALSLFLAACSSGPSPFSIPMPPPIVAPAPVPRPGSLIMTADWTAPLGAAEQCTGSPFTCTLPPGARWGLLPASDGAVDPQPNAYFPSIGNGWLGFKTPEGRGFALISPTTLDRTKPMSIRAQVRVDSADCNSGVAYAGPVVYGGGVDDGDPTGRYRAEYISCFAGDTKVRLWLYSPTYAGPIWDFNFADGQVHGLRIDWYPGDHVDYFLDDQIVFTEGQSFGHDPLDVPHDPHPALWFGASAGAVGQFDVYGG
jgi:hypothetical protein